MLKRTPQGCYLLGLSVGGNRSLDGGEVMNDRLYISLNARKDKIE
jgi:hypothetical protein